MADFFCYLCNSTAGGSWLCPEHKLAHQERVDAEIALERAKRESRQLIDESRNKREKPSSAILAAFDTMDAEARKAAAKYPKGEQTVNESIAWQVDGWIRGFDHMSDEECAHRDEGWCYVIAAGHDRLKIGSTRSGTKGALEGRLKGIQGMCPMPLHILRLFPGGERRERELHRKFAKQRLHGEWFSALILSDLPFGGCEECDFVVTPLDEDPGEYLRALRVVVDEIKKP